MQYNFQATLKSLRSDEDGEAVLQLRVPFTEVDKMYGLAFAVKQVLDITVKTNEDTTGDIRGE